MTTQTFPQQQRNRYSFGNMITTVIVMVLLAYLAYRFIPGIKSVVPSLPTAIATPSAPNGGSLLGALPYTVGQRITISSLKLPDVSNEFTVTAVDNEHTTVKDADGDMFQCGLTALGNLDQMESDCKTVKEPKHVSATGYHTDFDGHERPNPPAGYEAFPDCKSQGLRTWVKYTGDVTSYFCAK